MGKLVYGVGVNDADYAVYTKKVREDGTTYTEVCPYYERWKQMLRRCYSDKYKASRKTYEHCYVIQEWHYFLTFRDWMQTQDWKDKQLDKDILVTGNKLYSADTCCFVTPQVNSFLTERDSDRGEYPIGVDFHKASGKFRASCNDGRGKQISLGLFNTPELAHCCWLDYKLKLAIELASEIEDKRISEALIQRYKYYTQ